MSTLCRHKLQPQAQIIGDHQVGIAFRRPEDGAPQLGAIQVLIFHEHGLHVLEMDPRESGAVFSGAVQHAEQQHLLGVWGNQP